jgi:DNA-binding Xre family transcriptional regulator
VILYYNSITGMPREAHLRVLQLLNERRPDVSRADLAEVLGIGEATLRGYLEGWWTVLDRSVLERLADFLNCEIRDLFVTTETQFFAPFVGEELCYYLRRPDADERKDGRLLSIRDDNAISHARRILEDVSGVNVVPSTARLANEFASHMTSNCLVVGAPRVNPASEMALLHAFGVDTNNANAAKLPFHFRWHPSAPGRPTIVGRPAMNQNDSGGIWLNGRGRMIHADYWEPATYKERHIPQGRDCAVVVVSNHLVDAGRLRKLIVLAGFTGVGTEAAAMALARDYRELEPIGDERCVWGIVEVLYRKEVGTLTRRIIDYRWCCRVGGRCAIDFNPKRGPLRVRAGVHKRSPGSEFGQSPAKFA